MASADCSRSRASRWPVSVVVETKIARPGNLRLRPSIRGFAARTSPTETACTQIAPSGTGSISLVASPLADAKTSDCNSPKRSRNAPECSPRRHPRNAKYGASTSMPTAVIIRYRKYIRKASLGLAVTVHVTHVRPRLRTQTRYYSGSEREHAQLPAETTHRNRRPGKLRDASNQRASRRTLAYVR